MRFTKRGARRGLARLALAVIASAASAVSLGSTAAVAQAATRYPACVTSQIEVTAGATISNVTYQYPTPTGTGHAFSKRAVQVFFCNRGSVCHLLMGAPDITATRDATSAATVTTGNMTIPNPPPTSKRMVLQHHQRAEALFLFGSTLPKRASRGCHLTTATGLLVQGYAQPVPSVGAFFPRQMKNVCFPVPGAVGAIATNTGVAWAAMPAPGSRVLFVVLSVLLALVIVVGWISGWHSIIRYRSVLRGLRYGVKTDDLTTTETASAQTGPRGSDVE